MSLVKYRLKEVAADFGVAPKVIADIISKYFQKPKSNTQVLTDEELNLVFDSMTQTHQIASLEQVFAVKPAPKAEPPKPEAPKAEAPKQEAQQAAKPQQAKPQSQNQNRPQQPAAPSAQPAKADKPKEPERKRERRVVDTVLLRRAYKKAAAENPALERIFAQERDQANVQMTLNAKNYLLAAEPKGNLYGALYSVLATDDPNQRKSMHYIGSCIGRAAYLLDKAESFSRDKDKGRYNVFLLNGINDRNAARENARRQALAAVNDLVRAYGMLDVKLNRTLLDNIMILGLRHAIEPLDAESQPVQWELP